MTSHTPHMDLALARRARQMFEPYHAMIFFAPEARQAFLDLGLKGFWMGYFASRSAPLGPASAAVVTATFYHFHPTMVARALPDAWRIASPEQVLEVRLQAADVALRRLLGDQIMSAEMREAADLAKEATRGCFVHGRALFAGYTQLPWPKEPHLVLWHATTLLREHRWDGHMAALLTEGIDGCEAHLTYVGTGEVSRATMQPIRGWSDEEWDAAAKRLQQRGLLDEHELLTPTGRQVRQAIEDRTNLLALPPWQYLGRERSERLLALAQPFSQRIVDQGGIPPVNPMGLSNSGS
ncbi:MAG TPA: hypothetical protein VFN35_11945 [Ktedonobacteraceae bacterium]|nr:hypothetical protein [Ktedonobacteraceae bacterium]